jgi:hypothetical protein
MQELAIVALFTESSKPMLANHSFGWICPDMPEGTPSALGAMSFQEEPAYVIARFYEGAMNNVKIKGVR